MGGWNRHVCVLLTALCLAACSPQAPQQVADEGPADAQASLASEIVGVATISDGATIRVGERRIRFDGIEIPRSRAMCGETNVNRAATDALRSLIRSEEVRCSISDLPDDNGRDIAHCRVGDTNLGEYMVAQGWARATDADYAEDQEAARAAQRGVWGLQCASDPWPID